MLELLALLTLSSVGLSLIFSGDDNDVSTERDAIEPLEKDHSTTDLLDKIGSSDIEVTPDDDIVGEEPNALYVDINQVEWLGSSINVNPDAIPEFEPSASAYYVLGNDSVGQTINIEHLSNVIVEAGDGDVVFGGASQEDETFIAVLHGGAEVYTGDGNDEFYVSGDGNSIFAGGGDDFLLGGDGSSSLNGGDGNDTIYASNQHYFTPNMGANFADLVDDEIDTVNGGGGDDVIYAAGNDLVASNSGNDKVYFANYGGQLLDLTPDADQVSVLISDYLFDTSKTCNQFEVVVSNGIFCILHFGEAVVSGPYSSGVTFGFHDLEKDEIYDIESGLQVDSATVILFR